MIHRTTSYRIHSDDLRQCLMRGWTTLLAAAIWSRGGQAQSLLRANIDLQQGANGFVKRPSVFQNHSKHGNDTDRDGILW